MDEQVLCSRCGASPISIIVAGEGLCHQHRLEWLAQESKAAEEDRIHRVMDALDEVLSEPIGDDWDDHLRRMAVAAIEAAR